MFIHYDLAKALTESRRARAMAQFQLRSRGAEPLLIEPRDGEADVIEFAFGSHCESDQIGA